ncbi:hypothetical protein J6590_011407 [Homalodisca vitripennis]|nr:hypothetical protein J6590_011407 [Homalodisca vitripennis]
MIRVGDDSGMETVPQMKARWPGQSDRSWRARDVTIINNTRSGTTSLRACNEARIDPTVKANPIKELELMTDLPRPTLPVKVTRLYVPAKSVFNYNTRPALDRLPLPPRSRPARVIKRSRHA